MTENLEQPTTHAGLNIAITKAESAIAASGIAMDNLQPFLVSGNISHSLHSYRSKSESKLFNPGGDTSSQLGTKLSKKDSLKVEKKRYRTEKKRAAKELLHTLKDPSVIVMADWLKVRGTLKSWTRLWCILKPGLLVLYKSIKAKSGHWVGTVLLNCCELIERPSKKDGFCFKMYHPLDQSIWATKGPKGENFGAITQPLPYSYLIFRAPSESAGKCWMDALELALRCSALLMKTLTKDFRAKDDSQELDSFIPPLRPQLNDSDCEKHFEGCDLDDTRTDKEEDDKRDTDSDSEVSEDRQPTQENIMPVETPYIENSFEELGVQGDFSQTEEVADENKSIIWALVKQVRPGMDLSKVVLPTFILEPRSFLDKLSDYYYHSDILSRAAIDDDPFTRIKSVIKWYMSGFYKKPKGLKKPYNSILGESFRCYWRHPDTDSRTFYIAEQVSHHPPVSAFYATNRKDGFSVSGSVLAKSKFYGNSLSAILDGVGKLTLLSRGEDYYMTMPYAHCKGILIGTLTMELGGKVSISCEKTGYHAELEFKLKPFFGIGEVSNKISGKIKLGNETLATLDGKWDEEITIRDKRSETTEAFWIVTPELKASRLKRSTVPLDVQLERESERLWCNVTEALAHGDQDRATNEKAKIEDMQRKEAKERKAKDEDWQPKYFDLNEITGEWEYKFKDLRPWDFMNDVLQYEVDYKVLTKTHHKTPIVRATSIASVEESCPNLRIPRMKMSGSKWSHISESSTPDQDTVQQRGSESTDSEVAMKTAAANVTCTPGSNKITLRILQQTLAPIIEAQRQNKQALEVISMQMRQMQSHASMPASLTNRDLFVMGAILALQLVLFWLFK